MAGCLLAEGQQWGHCLLASPEEAMPLLCLKEVRNRQVAKFRTRDTRDLCRLVANRVRLCCAVNGCAHSFMKSSNKQLSYVTVKQLRGSEGLLHSVIPYLAGRQGPDTKAGGCANLMRARRVAVGALAP